MARWWWWRAPAARWATRWPSRSRAPFRRPPAASSLGACAIACPRPRARWATARRAGRPGQTAMHESSAAGERTQEILGLVVVAAGRGERFGADKVWLPLGDRPLVAHSLQALAGP